MSKSNHSSWKEILEKYRFAIFEEYENEDIISLCDSVKETLTSLGEISNVQVNKFPINIQNLSKLYKELETLVITEHIFFDKLKEEYFFNKKEVFITTKKSLYRFIPYKRIELGEE